MSSLGYRRKTVFERFDLMLAEQGAANGGEEILILLPQTPIDQAQANQVA